MNDLKRDYATLEERRRNLQSNFTEFYFRDFYDLEKNQDYRQIEDTKVDLEEVILDIKDILATYEDSEFIYLESVNYNHELLKVEIKVLFLTREQVIGQTDKAFIKQLKGLPYLTEIEFDEDAIVDVPVQGSRPRARVVVGLILDEETMPKVGEVYGS